MTMMRISVKSTLQQLADDFSIDGAVSLASDFLEDLPAQVEAIHVALAAKDYEAGVLAAHSLKGTSAIFGLISLQETAAAIESASKQSAEAELVELEMKLVELEKSATTELTDAIQWVSEM